MEGYTRNTLRFPRWGFLEVCLLGGAGHKERWGLVVAEGKVWFLGVILKQGCQAVSRSMMMILLLVQ